MLGREQQQRGAAVGLVLGDQRVDEVARPWDSTAHRRPRLEKVAPRVEDGVEPATWQGGEGGESCGTGCGTVCGDGSGDGSVERAAGAWRAHEAVRRGLLGVDEIELLEVARREDRVRVRDRHHHRVRVEVRVRVLPHAGELAHLWGNVGRGGSAVERAVGTATCGRARAPRGSRWGSCPGARQGRWCGRCESSRRSAPRRRARAR